MEQKSLGSFLSCVDRALMTENSKLKDESMTWLGMALLGSDCFDFAICLPEIGEWLVQEEYRMKAFRARWHQNPEEAEDLLRMLTSLSKAARIDFPPMPLQMQILEHIVSLMPSEAHYEKCKAVLIDVVLWRMFPAGLQSQFLDQNLPFQRHPIAEALSPSVLESAISGWRMALGMAVKTVSRTILNLLKRHRDLVVQWFDGVLHASLDRAKMMSTTAAHLTKDSRGSAIPDDACAMFMWSVMHELARPVLTNDGKMGLVDGQYWARSGDLLPCFVRSDKCTKITNKTTPNENINVPSPPQTVNSTDLDDKKTFNPSPAEGSSFNFVTQIFFLTAFSTRLGPIALLLRLVETERQDGQLEEQAERIRSTAPASMRPLLESRLKVHD